MSLRGLPGCCVDNGLEISDWGQAFNKPAEELGLTYIHILKELPGAKLQITRSPGWMLSSALSLMESSPG